MAPQELILSSCSPESSSQAAKSAGTPSILLHDLLTSSHIHGFKTSLSSANCMTWVGSDNGVGGAVMAVQEGKALLNVWAWQKDQQHMKIHLPERLTCFAVSPNGCWAAGGSPTGQLYLWELASGLLLSSITAHYRSLTSLKFSQDSHLLISSSLDAAVHVFLVSRLVDEESTSSGGMGGNVSGKPYGTLGDHTLAVRTVEIGATAGSSGGRCWTASDDGTVKLWSLHAPFNLLATFTLPPSVVPTTLAVDPTERYFYIGTSQGDIYHVPLFKRRGEMGSNNIEALEGNNKADNGVIKIGSPITALSLSISSTHLISGTQAGEIHIHSLPSHQHLRTITSHPGPISSVFTILRPPDLVSSSAASTSTGIADLYPIMEIKPFERMKVTKSGRDSHEVVLKLRRRLRDEDVDLLRPRREVALSGSTVTAEVQDEKGELLQLRAEVKRLKAGLDKAVKINEKMWSGVVDLQMGATNGS